MILLIKEEEKVEVKRTTLLEYYIKYLIRYIKLSYNFKKKLLNLSLLYIRFF